jgi:AT-rich interactive domain-containing protein 2
MTWFCVQVYEQICRYLTIHDIMLLIYTLESLYSLSSLGSPSCNAIVRAQGSIHTLVALLTVEAQSYGPEACIGMKVRLLKHGIEFNDKNH